MPSGITTCWVSAWWKADGSIQRSAINDAVTDQDDSKDHQTRKGHQSEKATENKPCFEALFVIIH